MKKGRLVRMGLGLALAAVLGGVFALAIFWWRRAGSFGELRVHAAPLPPGEYKERDRPRLEGSDGELEALRADALARAQVWQPPARPVSAFDFTRNVDPGFDTGDDVSCQYRFEAGEGWSPKFDCVRPDGEVLRVKYGRGNGEVFAEVAATRLLSALGFGADRVSVVRSVRCFGCPPYPYPRWGEAWNRLFRAHGGYREFRTVVVERPHPGVPVPHAGDKGWGWNEVEAIDASRGGAPESHRDALRLLAVFLAHWDNKPGNQRLMCLDEPKTAAQGCARPFAMIQDAGSTFGPKRVNVGHWRETPLWRDATQCRVDMATLPYDGATFREVSISEGGRRFLADRLTALSRAQVHALFAGARFDHFANGSRESGDLDAWTDTFAARVGAVAAAGPCPRP